MVKLSLEKYKNKMKEKYKDILKEIDNKLVLADSWSRGKLLYELLEKTDICPEELKYYVFYKWWDSIDSYHSEFNRDSIKEWIKLANIDIQSEVQEKLIMDDDGFIKVYRGTHELNEGWYGMSWTTDKEIAKKFANGCGVRLQTKNPTILTGRVSYYNVLGIFNDRKESEVLCYLVNKQDNIERVYNLPLLKLNY
ncbi:hypothetical protein RBU49_03110 [Clostridium sp. MB40-C1]|uniref:hypothetical protein n=1 Tax=Clostridium sp. MB40-C1 TaxID=3070996 RepID=UPI0027DEC2AC|nr:hypothetical protein [Clostridium sp. MB40-C1]WMJ81260.1 hypothetical protein RBU49_03110 [Clostridium sp. MB40-C1]